MKAGIDYTGITTFFFCHDGNGNFLLQKRSKNCRDEQGFWGAGGGMLEFGEDIKEGALRELQEEYGCTGVIQEQLPTASRVRDNNGIKTHWITLGLIIKVNPEEVYNNDPESIDEIGWFRLDEFPAPLQRGIVLDLEEKREVIKKYASNII